MAIDGVGPGKETGTPEPKEEGAGPKSPEGLQRRFDDIKSGKSENPREDLKNLRKDLEELLQKEESKPDGGDPKTLEMLTKMLEEVMNAQNVERGDKAGKSET